MVIKENKTEKSIIDILKASQKGLTRKEIKEQTQIVHDSDLSAKLKDLCFFEYIEKKSDHYTLLDKEYSTETRKNEKRKINHKYLFNKVFSGKYLQNNLGHEVINFMINDDSKRYIYVNPWGNISEECLEETEYVLHIMASGDEKEYELVAVSTVNNRESKTINKYPSFQGCSYKDIFDNKSKTEYGVSLVANALYLPKKKIVITVGSEEAILKEDEKQISMHVVSNPQHHISYADDGQKTISYIRKAGEKNDIEVIDELLSKTNELFEKAKKDVFSFDELPSELPFSVISGRVSLEVSMSNLISYFLTRDQQLCRKFLREVFEIKDITDDEVFEIIREEKNIDLLLKSKNHVVVIENKIDSDINGVTGETDNYGKKKSQLNKYYDYVETEYSKKVLNREYFILVPLHSNISRNHIDSFSCGYKYRIKTYGDLFIAIKEHHYSPDGLIAEASQAFLFSEFVATIEYLTWPKAKQSEHTAYVRLKQRINALKRENNGA